MTNIVKSGTVTVTQGSAQVTGRGTNLRTALVAGGTLIVAGLSALIESVEDETHLTLAMPWPGQTMRDAAYTIQRQRSTAASAIEANDRLAQVVRRIEAGTFLQPDAIGTRAQRSAHDDAPQGFIYAVPATQQGTAPEIYFKLSDRAGQWSQGHNYQGPPGQQGGKGDKGDTGNQGPRGEAGSTIYFSSYPDPNSRNVGRDGDVYIAADNKIWKKVQERWVLRRDLTGDKGDKGDKGDTGNKGDKGDKGDDGDRGPQGEVGLKGDKGDKGDTGNQGPRGEAGPRGLGGWLEHPNSPMTMNSGQDKIFSNIPAGTKHIKLVFADLSLTGAQNILVRLGDANAIDIERNYRSVSRAQVATGAFRMDVGDPARMVAGELRLDNVRENLWVAAGTWDNSDRPATLVGRKELAGPLTQLQIAAGASDNFDGGFVALFYQ